MKEFKVSQLFDLKKTVCAELFTSISYPWEIFEFLADGIQNLGKKLPEEEFLQIAPQVWVARDANVSKHSCLTGPCIIDREAEIRPGAYIRGSVIVGKKCVVGNSTELKNCILFDRVQVPHFNYVGDSVLGYCAHLGAGAVCSNVKSDKTPVSISAGDKKIFTGCKKLGAFLGDGVEVGCNSVLCPGTVIGKASTVYPLCRVRGYVPDHCICKDEKTVIQKQAKQEA